MLRLLDALQAKVNALYGRHREPTRNYEQLLYTIVRELTDTDCDLVALLRHRFSCDRCAHLNFEVQPDTDRVLNVQSYQRPRPNPQPLAVSAQASLVPNHLMTQLHCAK